jgi:hypothetical protein
MAVISTILVWQFCKPSIIKKDSDQPVSAIVTTFASLELSQVVYLEYTRSYHDAAILSSGVDVVRVGDFFYQNAPFIQMRDVSGVLSLAPSGHLCGRLKENRSIRHVCNRDV